MKEILRLACRRLSYISTLCNNEQKDEHKNPMYNFHLTHSGQPNQQLVSFWYLMTFGRNSLSGNTPAIQNPVNF